jgi:putative SOS response-associated peptidase YedK
LVIRENHRTGERSLDPLTWGLIPSWCQDPRGGRNPINAKSETITVKPTFRDAYRLRRCIVPVDGFFEWEATRGGKQPYAIAMKDGSPFGLAGLWENWKDPANQEWIRTFTVVTVASNDGYLTPKEFAALQVNPASRDATGQCRERAVHP